MYKRGLVKIWHWIIEAQIGSKVKAESSEMSLQRMSDLEVGSLHDAMLDAYSDYMFPMKMTLPEFESWLAQRGYEPSLSYAVLVGHDIAAFWFIGQKQHVSSTSAYALSVGCRPAYRRRGLARDLLSPVSESLVKEGFRRLILEVIDGNDRAVDLYRSQGFCETRYLNCFGSISSKPRLQDQSVSVDPASPNDVLSFISEAGDWLPSWQNSSDAMKNTTSELCTFFAKLEGETVAACIASPNGTVHQIAVSPSARRNGIGSHLLHHVKNALDVQALHAMNIPSTDTASVGFFSSVGAELVCSQFEMELCLKPSP